METLESFNGYATNLISGTFVWWFDEIAFGGTNYSNTPVGAVTHVEQLSVYVGYAAGVPVSSAWIYFHPKSQFASLWGGSTLPEFRKRGYYTALVAARSQEAKQRGARFLTIDAQPMSRPIAEKLGFQLLGFANACHWKVNAKKIRREEV